MNSWYRLVTAAWIKFQHRVHPPQRMTARKVVKSKMAPLPYPWVCDLSLRTLGTSTALKEIE